MAGLLELEEERRRNLALANPRSIAGLLSAVGENPNARMMSMAQDYARNLPQQLATNQQAMQSAIGGWNKTDFATGQPNPNYYPEAISELTQLMPNMAGMIAYHASPYKFSKFDPTKVGTGEGAQSYGVGAGYVAQNPRVANEYYKQFTNVEESPLMYKGKRVDTPWNDEISQRWDDVIQKNKFNQEQIEDFQGVLGNLSQVNSMQDIPNVLRGLSKSQQSIYNKYVKPELTKPNSLDAYMYKVDVKDEILPNMLDWDKPLTEQAPEVQKALKKLGISVDKKELNEFDNALLKALQSDENVILPNQPSNPTGAEIYQRIVVGSPETVSAKLNESGITGIKYLDAFSRKDTPNPTYNFVPFDPENMKILETTKGLLGE